MFHHRVRSFNFLTYRFRLDKWWLLDRPQEVAAREFGRMRALDLNEGVERDSVDTLILVNISTESKLNQTQGRRQYVSFHSFKDSLESPLCASCNRGATCDYVCNRLTEAINSISNHKPPWSDLFTLPLPVWHERDVERFRTKSSKNHQLFSCWAPKWPKIFSKLQILGPKVKLAVPRATAWP